jgi:carbonic anhydrase
MDKLLRGLEKFQSGYFVSHKEQFEELAHGQHPRILFITCADSRIDPNLILQADVGELFIIRNAGNIIPPYGSSNGGEGASVEYAIHALGIEEVIVCGHSHCGAMKGLLKKASLADDMPLVYDWLKHAEATYRLVKENYPDLPFDELVEISAAENVLNQLANLHTYPIVRSKIHAGRMSLHGWIYKIETGEVLAYDSSIHDFVYPQSRLEAPEYEYNLHPSCSTFQSSNFKINGKEKLARSTPQNHLQEKHISQPKQLDNDSLSNWPGYERLSLEQSERIYRGSSR